MAAYFQILSVAISCLLNALLAGKRYEMLSSRSYRVGWSHAVRLIDGAFGEGHCKKCYEFERDNFEGIQD
jgi:hypothetical protein